MGDSRSIATTGALANSNEGLARASQFAIYMGCVFVWEPILFVVTAVGPEFELSQALEEPVAGSPGDEEQIYEQP